MSVNVLYRTSARATGGRDGHSATLDGAVDVKLSTPKELGGAGGPGVSAAPADPASTRSNCSRPAMPPVFLALSSSWL